MTTLLKVVGVLLGIALLLLALGIVGLMVYEPRPSRFSFSSAGERIILRDGRRLAYLEAGDLQGTPILFFHGAPGSRLDALIFEKQSQERGIRLIAVDRPGFGLSDFQPNRTYLDWPKDVAELADHLGIDQFAVLGWSSGGLYAAVAAHESPERVAVAAIVAGVGPYAEVDFPKQSLSAAEQFIYWSADNAPWLSTPLFRLLRLLVYSDPAGLAARFFASETSAHDTEFGIQFRQALGASAVEALRQGEDGWRVDMGMEGQPLGYALEAIEVTPVLVFHGEQDSLAPVEIGIYTCRHIPTCHEPVLFPGEGHSVIYYRYGEIIQTIRENWGRSKSKTRKRS